MINEIEGLPDRLRQKAEDSLFFLATAGLGFDKLTPHFHYEMCKVTESAELVHWILMLVPRDHYKTTISTIAYATWRGIRNPNETGLIICNSASNAMKFKVLPDEGNIAWFV